MVGAFPYTVRQIANTQRGDPHWFEAERIANQRIGDPIGCAAVRYGFERRNLIA